MSELDVYKKIMLPYITFWTSFASDTIRMLYLSPISWKSTLMADVNLNTETVKLISGTSENKHQIAKFCLEVETENSSYRKLSFTGNDLFLIQEAKNVIEKYGSLYRVLKIYMDAAFKDYTYADASYLTISDIRKQMLDVVERAGEKGAFYCNTTDNLELKAEWHRAHDFEVEDDRVYAWKCANVRIAAGLKQWAEEIGFDTRVYSISPFENDKDASILYLLKKSL